MEQGPFDIKIYPVVLSGYCHSDLILLYQNIFIILYYISDIIVVAFETMRLRDQEGVGSNLGLGQVGRDFILVETHKVSLLKGSQ